jgi:hypothetical protein
MKVALCISGRDNWGMISYPFLVDSFINISDTIKVDVFYHSWNSDSRVVHLWKPKKLIIDSEEISYQNILKKVKIEIDYNKEHDSNRVYTTLLMHYGIHRIISEVSGYDYIIRVRPDVFLYEKIDLTKILNEIKNDKYDIWIPNKTFNYSPKGYNDQFAIGSEKNMKIYANTYNELSTYIKENSRWFPEEFLYLHLTKNNIRVYQEDVYYQLIRDVRITTNHKEIPPFKLY